METFMVWFAGTAGIALGMGMGIMVGFGVCWARLNRMQDYVLSLQDKKDARTKAYYESQRQEETQMSTRDRSRARAMVGNIVRRNRESDHAGHDAE